MDIISEVGLSCLCLSMTDRYIDLPDSAIFVDGTEINWFCVSVRVILAMSVNMFRK
jgi:hypothetical protein